MSQEISAAAPYTLEEDRNQLHRFFRWLLPAVSAGAAAAADLALPRDLEQAPVEHPYFAWLLLLSLALYLAASALGQKVPRVKARVDHLAPLYAGITLLLNLLNLLTAKLGLLPVLYFPAMDRVLAVLAGDPVYLLKCMAYSYRLLFLGWFFGALVGISTGILLGFSKAANYWIWPFIRSIGPINRLDSPGTGSIPFCGIRKRFPDCPVRVVSHYRPDRQRHRQYQEFLF